MTPPVPGPWRKFPESQKLTLGQAPSQESQDPRGLGTHRAVGVQQPPDQGLKGTLQEEILGNDKEAGQHAEDADGVCDQAQHLLQEKNKSANCCPKVRDPGRPRSGLTALALGLREDSAHLGLKALIRAWLS